MGWRAELTKRWRARLSALSLILALIVLVDEIVKEGYSFDINDIGRTVYMPFVFKCRSCGWGLRLELPCNAGPPSIRRKLLELVGVVIPSSCPKCGRVFDFSRIELGFAGPQDTMVEDSFKLG